MASQRIPVLVTKVNSGLLLRPVSPDGKVLALRTKAQKAAVRGALAQWQEGVARAAPDLGTERTHYIQQALGAFVRASDEDSSGAMLMLEPWGFALRSTDGEVVMGNSGSTPTEARARILLTYQAPLEARQIEPGTWRFERVYMVDVVDAKGR